MSKLYPLLMVPAFDPRPWGTEDLSPIYPNHKFETKIGEAWLSGDDCKAANGPLGGKSLAQLSQECGAGCSTVSVATEVSFPTRKIVSAGASGR